MSISIAVLTHFFVFVVAYAIGWMCGFEKAERIESIKDDDLNHARAYAYAAEEWFRGRITAEQMRDTFAQLLGEE